MDNVHETARINVIVSGLVQGVGYRAFVREQALRLGLAGYTENLPDGRVEVMAEGPRDDLEFLLVKMRAGPAHAEVSDMDVTWAEAGGLSGFHVY